MGYRSSPTNTIQQAISLMLLSNCHQITSRLLINQVVIAPPSPKGQTDASSFERPADGPVDCRDASFSTQSPGAPHHPPDVSGSNQSRSQPQESSHRGISTQSQPQVEDRQGYQEQAHMSRYLHPTAQHHRISLPDQRPDPPGTASKIAERLNAPGRSRILMTAAG